MDGIHHHLYYSQYFTGLFSYRWDLVPAGRIFSDVGAEYFFTGKLRKSISKQDIAVLEIYREKSEAWCSK